MYKMCKAFEEITKDARDEGYKSGIDEGYKSSLNDNVKSIMNTLNLSLEQALDALEISEENRKLFYS